MPREKKLFHVSRKRKNSAKTLQGRNSRYILPDSQINPLKPSVVAGKPVLVYHSVEEVVGVEKDREETERCFLPTTQAIAEYEEFRMSEKFSEFISKAHYEKCSIASQLTSTQQKKLMRAQDRQLRDFYRIGRGLEYKFDKLAFQSVVVGYVYRSKRRGQKRTTWSKTPRYFNGLIGPLVWTIGGIPKYVVFFRDNDRRRFDAVEISKYVVGSLHGIALEYNILVNLG
mmetsp:Transcript_5086/g.7542  ORF Transcript_5086/g.7542 Transcript_5086/m.7542 type:complete len:228 (+) Transcript_5086:1223-1906(+)